MWIVADIAPVWEGAMQHNAVKRFEIAGQDLTDLLAKELAKSQPHVKLDRATVEMLKEKYAMVAEDSTAYAATAETCSKTEHKLPDGQVYNIAFWPNHRRNHLSSEYGRRRIQLICLQT